MLTRKQIEKVLRLRQQTGGFGGFYESSFERGRMIKLKLVYKELPRGNNGEKDVVIQNQMRRKLKEVK